MTGCIYVICQTAWCRDYNVRPLGESNCLRTHISSSGDQNWFHVLRCRDGFELFVDLQCQFSSPSQHKQTRTQIIQFNKKRKNTSSASTQPQISQTDQPPISAESAPQKPPSSPNPFHFPQYSPYPSESPVYKPSG